MKNTHVHWNWLVLSLLGALMGCATIVVDSPEFLAQYAPPRDFDRSKDACMQATVEALREEEYAIRSADPATGRIETEKRKFTVNARSEPIVPSERSQAQHFQMEQAAKLELEVSGDASSCTVTITDAKLWNGVERLTKLQGAGARWFQKHLVDTLYSEIDDRLGE